MGNIYSGLTFQALSCPASSIDSKLLSSPAEKPNPVPIPDSYKQVEIQRQRSVSPKDPAIASVFIAQLDPARSATDDLAQFLAVEQHVDWGLLWCSLSR